MHLELEIVCLYAIIFIQNGKTSTEEKYFSVSLCENDLYKVLKDFEYFSQDLVGNRFCISQN